jgi:hypothetical protein
VIGPALNAVSSLMEIAVTDTAVLATYQLYVYAEIENYPNIYVFSN